jgi:hypothetical protein
MSCNVGSNIVGGWRFRCGRPPLSESCEGIELTEDTIGSIGVKEGEPWRAKGVSLRFFYSCGRRLQIVFANCQQPVEGE